jgi:phosphohistidine phosphatase
MQLYFLRHGPADWPDWDAARDEERPLTDKGVKRMKAEAKAIQKLGLSLDVILSSPLVRARQTAELVAKRLGLDVIQEHALTPGFDAKRLRGVLRGHAKAGAIMIVGHEPDFSQTIAELTGGRVVMKKGGLARVDLESLDPPSGKLIWLLEPKTLTL